MSSKLAEKVAVVTGASKAIARELIAKGGAVTNGSPVSSATYQTTDNCTNFREFLIEETKPYLKKIAECIERSLMLVTALSPVIGFDKASQIAYYAIDNHLTPRAAALKLGYVTGAEFDRLIDPKLGMLTTGLAVLEIVEVSAGSSASSGLGEPDAACNCHSSSWLENPEGRPL